MIPPRILWPALALLLLATRLAHLEVLWVEEAYPLAAARELLAGQTLYRDVWFDKPPLFAGWYALWGAQMGWVLRLAGTLFGLVTCWAVGRAASELHDRTAGTWAALLTGWSLAFGVPSATLALTPDALLMPLHALAVAAAASGRPVRAGMLAGAGLLVNTKAVFVLAAVLLWQWRAAAFVVAGFALPAAVGAAWLWTQGALGEMWQQVWVWGSMYARDTPFASPWWEGTRRTMNWAGFQAAGVLSALGAIGRRQRWRWAAWLVLGVVAAWLGWRFFPRYYFHLLVPVAVAGGIGLAEMRPRWRWAVLVLLLVPAIRFGPAHWRAATQAAAWSDLALFTDAHEGAEIIRRTATPEDRLFVWGYRPEYFPLTGLRAGTRFLDSQPVSGVLADRHLTQSKVSAIVWATRNRPEVLASRPRFVVDGLGLLNPNLALAADPGFSGWMKQYQEVGRTRFSIVYERRP